MLRLVNTIQLVARPHLAWDLARYPVALAYFLHCFEVYARGLKIQVYRACRRACNKNLVPDVDLSGLDMELAYAQLREVLYSLSYVNLAFCSLRAVYVAPLAQLLSLIVAVPEPAVEDCLQPLVPGILLLFC